MENSFFEYRDKTGVGSDSDSEIIDSSIVAEDFYTPRKKPGVKNQTVFVAESDESSTDDEDKMETARSVPKIIISKNGRTDPHVIPSSDDDGSRRGSIRQQSDMSYNKVVLSSSDEEEPEVSPELIPKRRPPLRPKQPSPDTSIIGRKKNKRIMQLDSDTDNSILIEHEKHKKLACLKDTPLRVGSGGTEARKSLQDDSIMDQSEEFSESEDGSESDDDMPLQQLKSHKKKQLIESTDETDDDRNEVPDDKLQHENDAHQNDAHRNDEHHNEAHQNDANKTEEHDSDEKQSDEDQNDENQSNEAQSDDDDDEIQSDPDDGADEDQMVMSRATRMSIMGVLPKGTDSDDSDFIQSDEKSRDSNSTNSLTELPETGLSINRTPEKADPEIDTSHLSCSPFTSPLKDITNEFNKSLDLENDGGKTNKAESRKSLQNDHLKMHSNTKENEIKNRVLNNLKIRNDLFKNSNDDDEVTFIGSVDPVEGSGKNAKAVDDEVTIIETKPEIIALSSDDEEEERKKSPSVKKSPSMKKSPREKENASNGDESSSSVGKGTMKQYLMPPSYPNQQVIYVKRALRENELAKLEGIKEDLRNVKYLLEQMDINTLPDGGTRLVQRLTELEHQVRIQGEKVANMVVAPEEPTPQVVKNDGFEREEKQLSWDEIQKGSNAVQPRMFGKQAMATHMAERNLILERLRDLHESLASRPSEAKSAPQPKAVKTKLMGHQLHALEWLRWRETQRPTGGILADDMGLGKTITMIALIVSDKGDRDDDSDDEERGSSKLSRGGTLVVCPASLMQQWAGEVGKHCVPHAASVCLHHGAQRATHAHRLATYDIVLTTYNILQRDNEKNGVLMKVLWRRIILDEAHIVRNHKSATSMAVSALKGRRRWCLTGTPVQNKDLDLFALLKFLRCTPFDDLTMWKKWIDNKSVGGQERMSTIMRCVLLRRTKAQLQQKGQLACLPDRKTHLQEVTLTKEEMNVYQKVLVFSKTLFAQFLHQRAEKQADGFMTSSAKNSAYDKMHKRMIALQGAKPVKSHEILVLLLRLRQVCCHCGLIAAMLDEDTAGAEIEDEGGQDLLAELNKLSLEDGNRRKSRNKEEEEEEAGPSQEGTTAAEAIRSVLSPNNPVFQLARRSSKIDAVMKCLKENVFKYSDHKAVVVSQWTSVLRLVETELDKERIKSVTLSGNVPVPARPPLIDAINNPQSNVRVMLLSLCAGGVGLNLCGANHLLLLDPHWNPQLEEQAQDRIYRVGQTKPVNIYRFMCVDTVEQSIRKLQQAKLELAENVLTGARNTNASKLTIEDLKMLFNMGQTSTDIV